MSAAKSRATKTTASDAGGDLPRKRVRLVQVVVQPVLVTDDGETLAPLQVEPIPVPANEWNTFVETGLTEALAGLEERVNATPPACPGCDVAPGQPHQDGCDVARCTECGEQRISCSHEESADGWGQIWNGERQ